MARQTHPQMAAWGRKGGQSTTAKKSQASRDNLAHARAVRAARRLLAKAKP